ncbi:MAG TPA: HAMP domain-containing sensor histidine kinase [Chryseosolibacter sp.]|nr:HAMP domain-containing sensor histidine kinase [Chryseosolibacter sp.]
MQTIISGNSAGEELIKAKEAINQFLNSCSHSLRGPLKSISGLNLLLKGVVTNGTDDPLMYIDMIAKSVSQLEALLQQFEGFLETSRKQLTLEPVNIDRLVDEVLAEVKKETTFHDVQVKFALQQEGRLYSDASAIKLVLFHLLQNAIVFRDETKFDPRVDIQVRVTKSSCSINVCDNGIGIDHEIQPRVFELFYRGSERSKGTGVGLYIVGEVIKKLSGTISVHSKPGVGTNLFLWIPNTAL